MLPLGAPPLLSGAPLSQPGVQIYWSEHNRIRKWQLRAQFNLSVRDEPVFRPPKSWSGPLQATSSHNNGHICKQVAALFSNFKMFYEAIYGLRQKDQGAHGGYFH
ncbi:uncharacterized protein LOC110430708 [Sorghum bicolor]|uniref:uncharacterized protein LOC110430708 n=1 Tax=Sorghum bicolor TaxID=4558 RepID=UPI000B426852|nr:uncharacterized protein LOC110430708 [Sorghum bicolor]|eukprot:XP_021304230.1 uncharacterized protein LOC110430708 [Sorghum bicolor]